jgi:hypothetical protein
MAATLKIFIRRGSLDLRARGGKPVLSVSLSLSLSLSVSLSLSLKPRQLIEDLPPSFAPRFQEPLFDRFVVVSWFVFAEKGIKK